MAKGTASIIFVRVGFMHIHKIVLFKGVFKEIGSGPEWEKEVAGRVLAYSASR